MIVGAEGYVGSVLSARLFSEAAVIYLAFMSNNDMCERNPELARKLNEDSLAKALEKYMGRYFIFASSVAAYGDCMQADENTDLAPTTAYGKSKKACEEMVRNSGTPYTIVRSASVCGVSPMMRYDLMVNRMVRDAAKTGRIVVNGGAQMRSHIHMDDVCRFYEWLVFNPRHGETFNLVCENQSVIDTATLVARTIGKTVIEVRPYTDKRSYTVSGEKLLRSGFVCRSSVEDAIVSVYLRTLYD